jgi:hypothetical protein
MDADSAQPRVLSRRVYFTVVGVLLAFWAATIVCVVVVFGIAAWDDRDGDDAHGATPPTATAVVTPTATPEPRPPDVPLSAAPIDGTFDTGELEQHLFFHIGCEDGVLVIVTTDEHVYAETFCGPIQQPLIVPFLGRAVRITIDEGRLDLVSVDGERMQFGVQRAWVEKR